MYLKANCPVALFAAALLTMVISGSAGAQVLVDASNGNGSFDVFVDATNSTGATIFGVNSGDSRAARSADGQITIPGWTLDIEGTDVVGANLFGGVNFAGSTPANDGGQTIVVNNGVITGTSDSIVANIQSGDVLTFGAEVWGRAGGDGAYSLSLLFGDGSTLALDSGVAPLDPTSPYNVSSAGSVAYAGPAQTSLQLQFVVDATPGIPNNTGGPRQALIDTVSLSLSPAAVPEPTSAALITMGALGLVARRRRRA